LANDSKSLELMRRMSGRWARERFIAVRGELERNWCAELPETLIQEIEAQGWFPEPSQGLGDWSPQTIARLGQALGEEAPAALASILTHGLAAQLTAGESSHILAGSTLLATCPYWDFTKVVPDVRIEFARGDARLDGVFPMVINGNSASQIIVTACTPEHELAICSIGREHSGVRISEPVALIGLRGAPARHVELRSVLVSGERVLCRGESARATLEAANRWLGWGVVGLLTGIVTKALDQASDYVHVRWQGGRRIGEHAPVAKLIGTAAAAKQHLLLHLNELCQSAALPPAPLDHARRLALASTDAALQSFGGLGYMCPGEAERCWRDARQAAALCSATACMATPSAADG
jgi:alkylation response protein AidB-like acyl-CoA dehydrogenase